VTTVADLDARYFRGFVDEHARFDRLVRLHLRPGQAILDAGAGHGFAFRHDYRDTARLLVGVDVEPAIRQNPNLDVATRADIRRLPFSDGTFDLVLAKYILEHLPDPLEAFRELRRVMRAGGWLAFHTPNRFHYVPLAARLSPTSFHHWFNARRNPDIDPAYVDAHKIFYRANDRSTIARLARLSGFEPGELEAFEPKPAYLFFNPLAYRLGIAYQRVVTRSNRWRGLRANLIGSLRAV
jgi:SAM-dependent methyltransferase